MDQKSASSIMDTTTLAEMLVVRGEESSATRWLTLLDPSGNEHHLSYGELLEGSQKVSCALKQAGVEKKQTVVIILPTTTDFLFTFFGVILTGATPVPLYPPVRMHEMDQYANQLKAILKDCGAQRIITSGTLHTLVRWMVKPADPTLWVLNPQQLLSADSHRIEFPMLTSQDTAMIQYTSGSTGAPKGVELTHDNLLSNIRAVAKVLDYRKEDVGVSWLPLYHDMGLIGAILSTLHFAIPLVLFSPLDFIQSPKRWLLAIQKYRGTISAAPNFAYSLCSRKIKNHELEGLDLTSWRVAINGAESIHRETLHQFSERFEPYGFSRKAFLAAYGLAESTLAVTFSMLDQAPRIRSYDRAIFELEGRAVPAPAASLDSSTVQCVSVGRPVPDHRVRIINQAGLELPDRTVGEVTVQGPSVMKGYYQKPQVTADALKDGWLYTGDLGFVDEGELHITGRSKDVIIKGGKNYYPQDIETSAGSVEGVRPGCVSAFGVPNPRQGTEEIVLVAETRIRSPQRRNQIRKEILKKVHRDIGCSTDRVILVDPGSVSKTSSGKIQRSLCRQRYLTGDLHRNKGWPLWHLIRFYLKSLLQARS